MFGFAQKGINNFMPNPPYTYSDFNNVLVQNDTIITYGTNIKKIGAIYRQGMYYAKLDTFGNILTDNFIIDTITNAPLSATITYGNFIKTSKNTFIGISSIVGTGIVAMHEVGQNLQVISEFRFQDTTLISNFDYKIVEAKDGYLLYGSVYRKLKNGTPPWLPLGFVRKIDREGNTEWLKYYNPVSYNNNILDMKVINDNKYVFILWSDTGKNANDPDCFYTIYIIDNQGNTIKSWRTKNRDPDYYHIDKIVSATENEIIVSGRKFIDYYKTYRSFQPYFAALNSELQVKWQKYYGFKSIATTYNALFGFNKADNGNYIGVGSMYVNPAPKPIFYAWLHKFTSQGDEIWSRTIETPYNMPNNVKKEAGELYDVAVLSSGSIIAVGLVPVGNSTYGYLVKMTSEGCLDTLFKCDKTIATKDEVIDNQEPVRIFPNPAQHNVIIQLADNQTGTSIYLKDLSGKILTKTYVNPLDIETSLSLATLQNGLYLLEIQAKNEQSTFHKLIIQH
jgi:hypothetical protein